MLLCCWLTPTTITPIFQINIFSNLQLKNLSTLTSLPEIVQCEEDFQKHFDKIDKLQLVLNAVNQDLTALENTVATAEDKLGYNNSGLKGFLKPWFGMSTKTDKTKIEDGGSETPPFRSTTVFKAEDYFRGAQAMESDIAE